MALIPWTIFLFFLTKGHGIEDERYLRGKEKYEAIKRDSSHQPRYSQCWLDALTAMENGCKHLTDDMQYILALKFTNCFLQKLGRVTYPCSQEENIEDCTKDMQPEAFNTFNEFFTHTHNMCHFLQAQVWSEMTELTIDRLAGESKKVVEQIQNSSQLQASILSGQNESLRNQEQLLLHGQQLKEVLQVSTVDVQNMMQEFKDTTFEQREMIFQVFDRVSSLQSLVVGEFTGFYSLIFYAVAILICYLLTSTQRTSGARFWLFVLMTMNVVCERLVIYWGAENNVIVDGLLIESSTILYSRLWLSRKFFCTTAVMLLGWFAYRFQDLNVVNNKMLAAILEQNHEVKKLLEQHAAYLPNLSVTPPTPDIVHNGNARLPLRPPDPVGYVPPVDELDAPRIEYIKPVDEPEEDDGSSGSEDSDTSSGESDHTYNGSDIDSESEAESSVSNFSVMGATAMKDEVDFLHRSTPVKELQPIAARLLDLSGTDCDSFTSSTPKKRGRTTSKRPTPVPQHVEHRYFLRSRRNISAARENPVVEDESPNQFGKLVKQLGRIAIKNAMKTRMVLQQKHTNSGAPVSRNLFSSDED